MTPRSAAPTEQSLLDDLEQAIERAELRLEFQPVVRLGSAAVVGAEALLRWRHPRRGNLAPAEFLGAAERGGLIGRIGDFALQQACQAAARWPSTSDRAPFVSVNVLPVQLAQPGAGSEIVASLSSAGIAAGQLVLELTTGRGADDEQVGRTVDEVREAGVRVALDDFGSATSLRDMKRLAVDIVKLDREFVASVEGEPRDSAFVLALLDVANARDVEVVAKGVESREQAWRLAELGCRYGQGFFFSKPLGDSGMVSVLRKGTLRT
jgi:EAL domain-containing protein (putative c-di-GMP-specific phosphodiesterase class I)